MIVNLSSSQIGAPQLAGVAGALKGVLKAALVDGFGASGITSIDVAGGVATATFAAAHPYRVGTMVAVSGAVPAQLNGVARVLSASALSISFATTAVDGAASTPGAAKVAPAGWQEVFFGTNLTALKPAVPEATGCVLRVDDTGTSTACVRSYESMTDINTGVGPVPLDSQVSGGVYWPKSASADATARPWIVVADERGVHVAVDPAGTGRYSVWYAGDIASLKSGDAWSWLLCGNVDNAVNTSNIMTCCNGYSGRSARAGAYMARAYTGLGGSLGVGRVGVGQNGSAADAYSGTANYSLAGAGPNGANNGLMLTPVELIEAGVRGTIPGLYHARSAWAANYFSTGVVVAGTDDLSGRSLMAISVAPPIGSTTPGVVFLDLTGPWVR